MAVADLLLRPGTRPMCIGDRFSTFEDACKEINAYEAAFGCKLFMRDSKTLTNYLKRAQSVNVSGLLDRADQLKYHSVWYSCRPSRNDKREVSSEKCCPFKLRIRLSSDQQALEVVDIYEKHNHALKPASALWSSIRKSDLDAVNRAVMVETTEEHSIHGTQLARMLLSFRRQGLFCDVSVLTKDHKLCAHSAVLAAASPCLRVALQGVTPAMSEDSALSLVAKTFDLSAYDTSLVEQLLEFIYTGMVHDGCILKLQDLLLIFGIDVVFNGSVERNDNSMRYFAHKVARVPAKEVLQVLCVEDDKSQVMCTDGEAIKELDITGSALGNDDAQMSECRDDKMLTSVPVQNLESDHCAVTGSSESTLSGDLNTENIGYDCEIKNDKIVTNQIKDENGSDTEPLDSTDFDLILAKTSNIPMSHEKNSDAPGKHKKTKKKKVPTATLR